MGSSRSKRLLGHSHMSNGSEGMEESIWLDGDENSDSTRRFIAISRGIPMIRGLSKNEEACQGVRLDNPKQVMETIINIMGKNCSNGNSVLPPLVENLGQLMRDLGNAAWIVRSQSMRGNAPD